VTPEKKEKKRSQPDTISEIFIPDLPS